MTKIHGRYTKFDTATLDDFIESNIDAAQVKTEWVGMPEFNQHNIDSFATIVFRVVDEEHLKKLSELVGQPLTHKTKTVWYPKQGVLPERRAFYVDEEDV